MRQSLPLLPSLISCAAAVALILPLGGCSKDRNDDQPAAATPATVVDVVAARSDTSTLTTAVTAQGLVPTLKGTGPFTVFAPTNTAFTAFGTLPTGAALTNTLTYHVLGAQVLAADALAVAAAAGETTTVQGAKVYVDQVGADLYINQAKVTVTNQRAGNGVVHVIDAVITVPDTIYNTLSTYGLSSLKGAIDGSSEAATLTSALQGTGNFTVFAPTNAAFTALGSTPSPTTLSTVLKYHVLTSTVKASTAVAVAGSAANQVGTLLDPNKKLTLTVPGGALKVNGASVLRFNIRATNGVIHLIDAVLLPPASA